MKIAISANGKNLSDLLDKRFGRCEFFQVYDTETKEIKIIQNKGNQASGGAGIAAANQIVDENIEIIITGNLGPNAFDIIEENSIKAYTCECLPIEDILKKYDKKELKEITVCGPKHQG
ncbi:MULTISPECIES: NifB/NifX family molybdenum-iron cluster-binding protein [Paraclostridium]|uniref:Diguanylate cyclase n=1 Tax=Paraclostridium benzoelyticum TaxID=1629550 RepID=A0A0M3DGH5_9FIRM|nr:MULTISPECIES: NifB/NifX family molybdenum-iron cluster-binding protein [Paraclostridium]KKY00564.1 diguanylate cyclase [Paraclostridium benzoelyticum]MCU9815381.1 NifB/NifX family molybdenum-iron cluster-binding protein [Paraclostridium sp. AKS73]OXX83972.1 diguanylate cyclase [Paraclostridium benzoelyticum]